MAVTKVSDIERGDSKTITATFRNRSDVITDPTAVTFEVRLPSGAVTTYTYGVDTAVVKDAVGVYHLAQVLDAADVWHVRVAGTGAVTAAHLVQLTVTRDVFR